MLGERAFSIAAFERIQNGDAFLGEFGETGDSPGPLLTFFTHSLKGLWSPWLKLDEVYSLRIWKRIVAGMTPMKVPVPQAAMNETTVMAEVPKYAILTRTLMPVFYRIRQVRDRMEVETRQREIALALAAYRSAHGTYPPDLKTAATFEGQPLRPDLYRNQVMVYRRTGGTFVLYSVGPNGKDDQGRGKHGLDGQRMRPRGNSADDITWGFGGPQ